MNAFSPWFSDEPITPTGDEFLPGDVVVLRGQDQLMTVEGICDCGNVAVVWFAGSEDAGWTGPHRDAFDPAMLINLDDQDDD